MVRVGILGAGFMGGTHARAFAKLDDVQIVGISSRSGDKAAALAKEFGAEPFTDAMALATDPRIDAVSITLPTQTHLEYTRAALAAGKHVLCEKPMACTLDECDQMIAAAKKSDRILMIGQTLRFWPEYGMIRDLVKGGALGKPLSATAKRLAGPPRWAEYYLHPEWSGGEVVDLQIHDMDAFNWFFGKPKTVYSRGQRSPESGGWDLALTLVDYGDVVAFAEGSAMQTPEYPFTMTLWVLCENGSVEYTVRMGGAQVGSRDSGINLLEVIEKGKPPRRLQGPGLDAYDVEVAAFVESVRTGQPVTIGTPEEARLALATSLAARRSLETGQVVTL
jgi:predicted dehydrogenase